LKLLLSKPSLCTSCKRNEQFFSREYSGEKLCKKCFAESIEAKVRATISRYHMLSYDDHLAVAVSGGKDSLSLLHVLAKMKRFRPKTMMTAVTVDEGIAATGMKPWKLQQQTAKN
jgi:cytoplasmic tRNA 2-thiolation protein 1